MARRTTDPWPWPILLLLTTAPAAAPTAFADDDDMVRCCPDCSLLLTADGNGVVAGPLGHPLRSAMGDTAVDAPEPSRFGKICVFCGSNPGNCAVYGDAALDLGKELVARGMDLVYGGGSVGLMGLIAQTVLDGGYSVLGVIPRALMPLEVCIKY